MKTILMMITISLEKPNQEIDGNDPDECGSDIMLCRGRSSSFRANMIDEDLIYILYAQTELLIIDSLIKTMAISLFEMTFGIQAIRTRTRWI